MVKQPPSIFNDVIGPVMRGPSSSHTAASVRIGKLVRQLLPGRCVSFTVDFDPQGSLATTYHGQGSDFGLLGGLLDMDLTDPELAGSLELARRQGIAVSFNITGYPAEHPNTYRITAAGDSGAEMQFIFISTGGGMIELQKIGNLPVSIAGDFYETLLFFDPSDPEEIKQIVLKIERMIPGLDYCTSAAAGDGALVNIKTGFKLSDSIVTNMGGFDRLKTVTRLEPVLPVLSRKDCAVPFNSARELLEYAEQEGRQMWELAVIYESARGNIPAEQVYKMAQEIVRVMQSAVAEGLAGTFYRDRILGPQAFKMAGYPGRLIGGSLLRSMITHITAIMETKSAMGMIVAAPTAGSCGALPGTVLAVAADSELDNDAVVKGLLAAGLIGTLIAGRGTFAAEACGCQAECGSGSGMAAAGLVQMMGGTVLEALDAASMALQNILGMVCDPVADRVEVPCLGKNILAGMNAVSSANMALAGYDKVIPLDETIEAMQQVGRMLPAELRCTGRAGLSVTKTALEIHHRLNS